LNPAIHLLSQLSQPHPGVKVSLIFPEYFGKDARKSLLDISFKAGETQRALIGIQNNGQSPLRVKNVTGAYIDDALDKLVYAQNFSIESYEGKELQPSESMSIAYEFFTFTSINPQQYKLQLALFLGDDEYEYTNLLFNAPVTVLESD